MLDVKMHEQLMLWIDARNKIWDHDACSMVFVTKNGNQLGTSAIAKITKRSLENETASPTKLRKLTVTMVGIFNIMNYVF